ncbi:nectin-4-like isoform X2 [Paramormyrops kingsleyae]|nr:nectin-4-like isoform X2 [Paramormyrops kingsleyae]
MEGTPSRLPCQFQEGDASVSVVQVTWTHDKPDGTKEMVITAHPTEGLKEFGVFSGRVKFESADPMTSAALIIQSTAESDEGQYTCHISTFPLGNFEQQLSLTVWVKPISHLEPVVLMEGQPRSVAATCRSAARPLPVVTWDTELKGQIQNRTSSIRSVATYYFIEPLRSMDGKKLDCLVSHPSLPQPYRISNYLVVHYSPEAAISGYKETWQAGQARASLKCKATGNPAPTFSWSRNGGALPPGVSIQGETLSFSRPLLVTDSGVYDCLASNTVGTGKDSVNVVVTGVEPRVAHNPVIVNTLCGVIGVLLMITVVALIAVKCHYQKKKKKLEKQLDEKKEELISLSRQNSVRRLNSDRRASDTRIQLEDNIALRLESAISTLKDLSVRGYSRYDGSMVEEEAETIIGDSLHNSMWPGDEDPDGYVDMDGGRQAPRHRAESFLSSTSLGRTSMTDVTGLQHLGSRERMSLLRTSLSGGSVTRHPGARDQAATIRSSISAWSGTQALGSRDQLSATQAGMGVEPQHLGIGERVPSVRSISARVPMKQRVGSRPRSSPTQACEEKWEDTEEELYGEDDCRTNSSQISEALSSHFHLNNGYLQPKPHPNAILLHPRGQII